MTYLEWEEVKERLSRAYGTVHLQCDSYDVCFQVHSPVL